jgi:uncharacterized ferritin-like protein (DUF455 family)
MSELRQRALQCLYLKDPEEKSSGVFRLFAEHAEKSIVLNPDAFITDLPIDLPGRPDKPVLVDPLRVKKRAMNTLEGRSALLHSLAHIEFNAINLALDAVWRFQGMPPAYYEDWLKVAKEEAYHFTRIKDLLAADGYQYGDFPAHNSLWEMAQKTQTSVLARMALVPRTMEARGLDAVPAIRERFAQIKDTRTVEVLDIILRDEIGHVAIGNCWFNYLCDLNNLDPINAYSELAKKHKAPVLRGPFNFEARTAAGFTEQELNVIKGQAI